MEVSSDRGFWEFHQKGVASGPQNLAKNLKEQRVQEQKRGGRIQRETTNLHNMKVISP